MRISVIKRINRKRISFLIFLSCALLMCFALYLELVEGLDPCPLCSLQRACMALGGGFALLASLHNPGRIGFLGYAIPQVLFFSIGGALAGRQIYLQSLPTDLVPSCGPDLDYLLEIFPVFEVLRLIILDDGSCAEVMWKFLGLSIPQWTILSFFVLTVMCLLQIISKSENEITSKS
ncbi:disulfide bond formation protein B [Gammaproteobacteria bacterium]|nr:disulfide bond formation protein B [Gammaproteobacteria bacterium]